MLGDPTPTVSHIVVTGRKGWFIDYHDGRMQPYTAWRRGGKGGHGPRVAFFCVAASQVLALIDEEIGAQV